VLEKVREAASGRASVEWNLGVAYAEVDRPEDALACWKRLALLEPGNWQTTAKIVQAFQALGRGEERDRAIAQLLAERKQTKDPQLAKQPWFCREQFKIDGRKVMVIEYFSPTPPRSVYVAFLVQDAAGKEAYRYSLGSYDETNEIARATGQVGPNDRLYHLDYYQKSAGGQVHRTYGFFSKRPDYAALRERVVKAMKDEITPVSSSSVPTAEKK
jgi:tetratricopeptide (TPR) repeat protein